MTRWGVVSTIKAPLPEIARFAAWHLEAGASALHLYLDEDDPEALDGLNAHPAITARHTDAAWWEKRKGRPEMHQNRQAANARHANNTVRGLDWLAHIDVDEFLIAETPVAGQLAALPDTALCARVRPIEALAPGAGDRPGTRSFKAFHLAQTARREAATRVFGPWAQHLSGGFLSHVAGKLFFRPGTKGQQVKIHNVILDGQQNPGEVALPETTLAHFHAADPEHFLAAFRYRMSKGSYRSELKPQVRQEGALSLFDLFRAIEAEGGEDALRTFFDEVATATPDLTRALEREGLLRRLPFDPDPFVAAHLPHLAQSL
ncbi:glycosyltransferase family 2 protein [Litorisediminicola beolgyonensis]|uniref:Glycosyltransferase family 2 protein n=1 Tax=Litorisediminicola beolgyonensis TaxID=1173614 RepID=A0ABW3ZMD1_9RHOB